MFASLRSGLIQRLEQRGAILESEIRLGQRAGSHVHARSSQNVGRELRQVGDVHGQPSHGHGFLVRLPAGSGFGLRNAFERLARAGDFGVEILQQQFGDGHVFLLLRSRSANRVEAPDEPGNEFQLTQASAYVLITLRPDFCYALICSTILPGRCGAPASISCAVRASLKGKTLPTRVRSLPLSKSALIFSSRAVVTSTRKKTARSPRRRAISSGIGDATDTSIPFSFSTPTERSRTSPPCVSITKSTGSKFSSNFAARKSITVCAPSPRTYAASAAEAVATTCSPASRESCTANAPTLPPAPWISTRRPRAAWPYSKSICQAVTATTGADAASTKFSFAGLHASIAAGAAANSAYPDGNASFAPPYTSSPGLNTDISLPTASTTPAKSEPRITGKDGLVTLWPSRISASHGPTPAALIATRTSRGPGAGRGMSA